MKRLVCVSLVCAAILFLAAASLFTTSLHVNAAAGATDQMHSATFNDQSLSYTKTTLLTIPFSVSVQSKLEATSLMNVLASSNPFYYYGNITCELDLDTVSFFSVSSLFNPPSIQVASVGLTGVATKIAIGSHVFGVACSENPSGLTFHSLGTSIIITGSY